MANGSEKNWNRKHLLVAIALLLVWPLLDSLANYAIKVPFWVTALFLNCVSFWLVFRCPERPLLNAILFVLAFLVIGMVAVGVERIVLPGVEPGKFTTAVQMVWAIGLIVLMPGLIAGLLSRWLWR
jgi:hypothetical protein